MYRDGRPIEPHFESTENLYWRCPESAVEGRSVSLDAIKFPNISVNRGRFSEPSPEDVLIPNWLDWRVAQFTVQDIPTPLVSEGEGKRSFDFQVEHDPCECNYAHSEIRTYRERIRLAKDRVPPAIKLKFRYKLKEHVIALPRVNG